MLLDYGADIESKDPWDGRTALMAACLSGQVDTANFLLSRRADVNAQNCFSTTSLIWAADNGHVDTVKLLLKYKPDLSVRDKNGRTASNEHGQTALSAAKQMKFKHYKNQYEQLIKLLEDADAKE